MNNRKNYAGMDLLLSGYIGSEGTRILARKEKSRLAERLPEDFLAEIENWQEPSAMAEEWKEEPGMALIRPLGAGGLFAALWELAEETGSGFCLDLKRLLLRQETVEVCEVLGLNPYRLPSGGCFLILSENGGDLLWRYRKRGLPLTMAGKMSADRDKKLCLGEHVGYLNRPKPAGKTAFMREKGEVRE